MKKKIIIIITTLLLMGTLGFNLWKGINNQNITSVRLIKVKNENVSKNLHFEGLVNSKKTYGLYKKVPMIIKDVKVEAGTLVKKGDELIVFNGVGTDGFKSTGVSNVFIKLEEAKLEVDVLEKQLIELQRKKDVVKFQLSNAKDTAKIMKELLKQDGVSSLEANNYITDAALKDLEYNNIILDISLAKQRLKIKKNRLDEELKETSQNLIAPENGIITEVFSEKGMMVALGKPLLSFSSINSGLEVRVALPIYQSQGVSIGANVNVVSKGSIEEKKYSGKVVSISNFAQVITKDDGEERYLTVTIELNNSKGLLPGSNVGVEIIGKGLTGINVVDPFSVMEDGEKNYVYIVEKKIAKKIEVKIGVKTLSKYEVLNLPAGTEVVVNPFKVRDGERVIVKSIR